MKYISTIIVFDQRFLAQKKKKRQWNNMYLVSRDCKALLYTGSDKILFILSSLLGNANSLINTPKTPNAILFLRAFFFIIVRKKFFKNSEHGFSFF